MSAWHVAFCKSRSEDVAALNLRNQGYDVYFPQLLCRRRRAGKWVRCSEPLFPRYLFLKVRDEEQSLAPVRSTVGVSGLVRFGGLPAAVSDEAIVALRARESAQSLTDSDGSMFRPGERVKLVDGPLRGVEAVFDNARAEERVTILLDMIGKTNSVVVHRDWLVAVT